MQKTKGKPTAEDKFAGAILKNLRVSRKVSQEKLAVAIGVTFQQVQKYETGYNRITVSRLHRICKFFNVSPNEFFPDTSNNKAISPQQAKVLKICGDATDKELKILKDFFTTIRAARES